MHQANFSDCKEEFAPRVEEVTTLFTLNGRGAWDGPGTPRIRV